MNQWVVDASWPAGRVWDLKDEHGTYFGFVQRCTGAGYVFGNSRVHGQRMFPSMAEAAKWVVDASVLPASLLSKEDV